MLHHGRRKCDIFVYLYTHVPILNSTVEDGTIFLQLHHGQFYVYFIIIKTQNVSKNKGIFYEK